MVEKKYSVFLTYDRNLDYDDDVTKFRESLEKEVMVRGHVEFAIFQDKEGLVWGDDWKQRIAKVLKETPVLMPVLSPKLFKSDPCRFEIGTFLDHNRAEGRKSDILPVYFIDTPELHSEQAKSEDRIIAAVASKDWIDWRDKRLLPTDDPGFREAISKAANSLTRVLNRLNRPEGQAVTEPDEEEAGEQAETPAPEPPAPPDTLPPDTLPPDSGTDKEEDDARDGPKEEPPTDPKRRRLPFAVAGGICLAIAALFLTTIPCTWLGAGFWPCPTGSVVVPPTAVDVVPPPVDVVPPPEDVVPPIIEAPPPVLRPRDGAFVVVEGSADARKAPSDDAVVISTKVRGEFLGNVWEVEDTDWCAFEDDEGTRLFIHCASIDRP